MRSNRLHSDAFHDKNLVAGSFCHRLPPSVWDGFGLFDIRLNIVSDIFTQKSKVLVHLKSNAFRHKNQ